MKRRICMALAFLILVASLAGCAGAQLAEGFDKDAVTEKAKQTVDVINTLDYSAMVELLREDLQSQVTAEKLKQGWDTKLASIGEFEKYDNITVIGKNTGGVDYAVAVVVAKYKDGSATYTLSFDPDMELAGLYMK